MLYFSVPLSILSFVNVNKILGVHFEGYLQPRDFLNKSRKCLSYLFPLFHLRGASTLYIQTDAMNQEVDSIL